MDARRGPELVLFDAIETLFSLSPVAAALERLELGDGALDRFFTRLLRDGFALGCSGRVRSFGELGAATLAWLAPSSTDDARAAVLAAFRDLPAHADVVPAMERLHAENIRVAVLTNGSAALTEHLVSANRLGEHVERVISVEEVGVWKPSAVPYRHAVASFGMEPSQVAMVAVHAWDTHGARGAGLTAAWAARLEGTYSASFDAPHVRGDNLVDVADVLVALAR
jgi:2-haloacid dehalogenase